MDELQSMAEAMLQHKVVRTLPERHVNAQRWRARPSVHVHIHLFQRLIFSVCVNVYIGLFLLYYWVSGFHIIHNFELCQIFTDLQTNKLQLTSQFQSKYELPLKISDSTFTVDFILTTSWLFHLMASSWSFPSRHLKHLLHIDLHLRTEHHAMRVYEIMLHPSIHVQPLTKMFFVFFGRAPVPAGK